MKLDQLAIPEIYESSQDFRFFIKWIALCLGRLQYDIENMPDLYDPLRCPSKLLWMLADTMGYKYDDRFPTAYIRLILLYFISMIRIRGSQDGMILAANTNLAQYRYRASDDSDDKYISFDRLDDTSIPVNTTYVSYNTEAAYIQVTYFADEVPVDACLEYVRPVGMYCFQSAGVRYDANTKISIEAKLADKINSGNTGTRSITATHIGHYTRKDYASMQKTVEVYNEVLPLDGKAPNWIAHTYYEYVYIAEIQDYVYQVTLSEPPDWETNYHNYYIKQQINDFSDNRDYVFYRNSKAEVSADTSLNPGYRAISSLQLCNNEGVINSLVHSKIFFGLEKDDVSTFENDSALTEPYNLMYNADNEPVDMDKVTTVESGSTEERPIPQVAPIMGTVGDAIMLNNDKHTEVVDGEITVVDNPHNTPNT